MLHCAPVRNARVVSLLSKFVPLPASIFLDAKAQVPHVGSTYFTPAPLSTPLVPIKPPIHFPIDPLDVPRAPPRRFAISASMRRVG
jgi:hypothetical protein